MNSFVQDLRYALRAFTRNPGFTATAVLSLAIGIGANTTIFSVADALLLHPLPYQDSDRLAILWNRSPGLGIAEDWFSTAQYFDIGTRHQGFEQVAIAIGGNYNLTGYGEPERVGTMRVSSNLLPMLGAQPKLGRLFNSADDQPGAAPAALLSYGTWSRRYGSDPGVIGKSIALNGQTYHVAGVLQQSFSLPQEVLPTLGRAEQAEILLPLPLNAAARQDRNHEDYNIVGKLKRGVSVQKAQAEMDALTASLRRDHPEVYPPNGGLTFSIVPLMDQVVGDVRRSLLILIGSVCFVLLIACANVANLLLSRSLARQKEMAVRAALGAGRRRILQQLLTESATLATLGGALGILLSLWTLRWIHVLGSKSIPRLADISMNGEVLLFTMLLSLASGILFGLAPALRISRLDLQSNLKDAGRGASGGSIWGRGNGLRKLLVGSELALSVMLLIGAGLLIRSFMNLQRVQPGFSSTNVLTFELTMTGRKYSSASTVVESYKQLFERLEQVPGVSSVGATTSLPMSQMFAWGPILVEGRIPPPGEIFVNADERVIDRNYFQAMGIPLRGGRMFNDQDTKENPQVAIVDDFMAKELWPNQDPIGKRIKHGGLAANAPWMTVVGVVGRVKQYTLDSDTRIAFYLPHTQSVSRGMTVVAKTATDAAALMRSVRSAVREIDPDLPLYMVRTMSQRIDESLARRRFSMMLLGAFAALAMTLAMIGTYGVMSYLVNQGTREVGIRMALGASQGSILTLVIRRGMTVALTGVLVGLLGALAITGWMRSLLFGVTVTDPVTFTLIPSVLAAVALLASYLPARRASRIDSMQSLRSE